MKNLELIEYKKHAERNSCLWSGNEEEASGQQQALNSCLEIAELDPLEVEYRLAVSQHQGIKSKNLKHLECGHQSATALLYYVANWLGFETRIKVLILYDIWGKRFYKRELLTALYWR